MSSPDVDDAAVRDYVVEGDVIKLWNVNNRVIINVVWWAQCIHSLGGDRVVVISIDL